MGPELAEHTIFYGLWCMDNKFGDMVSNAFAFPYPMDQTIAINTTLGNIKCIETDISWYRKIFWLIILMSIK